MDLTGITNENEYYSHHYITAILEGDLKDLFKNWTALEKESETKSPPTLLKQAAGNYFALCHSIELLGNEAVFFKREKLKEGVFKDQLKLPR